MSEIESAPYSLATSRISFVVPTKRDTRLQSGIIMLESYAKEADLDYEILVCGEFFRPLQKSNQVRPIHVSPAEKGACVRTGVLATTGNTIVVCDADVPVPFGDIKTLCALLVEFDIAVGNRYSGKDKPHVHRTLSRRISSKVFRFIVGRAFGLKQYDTQCGIKAFRAPVARALFGSQIVCGLSYDVEIFLRALEMNYDVVQHRVHWEISSDSTIKLIREVFPVLHDLWHLFKWQNCNPERQVTSPCTRSLKKRAW